MQDKQSKQGKQDVTTAPMNAGGDDERIISWNTFGPFLAQVRERCHVSQAILAARLGCDRTSIWRLEHNKYRPSRLLLNSLALAYELSAQEGAKLNTYTLLLEYHLEELERE